MCSSASSACGGLVLACSSKYLRPAGGLVDPAGGLQCLEAPHAVGLQDVGKVLQMS